MVCKYAGSILDGLPTSCLTVAPRFQSFSSSVIQYRRPADERMPTSKDLSAFYCSIMALNHIQIHTHTFNGPLSETSTTRVSRYQKGKTNLDFTEATDSEWQWHQLGHMQVCTSCQTDNHARNPPLSFYRPDALPAAQPTASKL